MLAPGVEDCHRGCRCATLKLHQATQSFMDQTDTPLRKTASQPQSPPKWLDRDLSWLEFNRRVLAQAMDDRTALLERVKFLAIFTSNLDEFFMKRIAILRERETSARLNLLPEIRERLLPMLDAASTLLEERLMPELANHGIHLCSWDELSPANARRRWRSSTARSRPR